MTLPLNAALQDRMADPEFLAWAVAHQRELRRRAAGLAQIASHPDPHAGGDVRGQERAWALRQAHDRHLHDSAIAQIRPHA